MSKNILKFLLAVLVLSLILILLTLGKKSEQNLKIYFFDVGQGDASLIVTPTGENILLDGGPDNTLSSKIGAVLPFYERTIDLLIITHSHDDHYLGLLGLLKRYRFKRVLVPSCSSGRLYDDFISELKNSGAEIIRPAVNERFFFTATALTILSGEVSEDTCARQGLNASSIVARLVYGKTSVLLMGDLEIPGEEILLNQKPLSRLRAQILKIGHHGSTTSSGEDFLKTVNPQNAIISVGSGNTFGHPSLRILWRLQHLQINIFRTDLLGDILFVSDGNVWNHD